MATLSRRLHVWDRRDSASAELLAIFLPVPPEARLSKPAAATERQLACKQGFGAKLSRRSSGGPSGCISEKTMNLRTWVRIFVALLFSISGLVETLSATGLVVSVSPDGRWGPGVHTLAVSGPLQIIGAALVAFGRKTRWTLSILGCYIFLVSVFGNLPLIFNPDVGGSAITGLLINLTVMGGTLYWFRSERIPSDHRAKPALSMTNPAPALPVRLLLSVLAVVAIAAQIRAKPALVESEAIDNRFCTAVAQPGDEEHLDDQSSHRARGCFLVATPTGRR